MKIAEIIEQVDQVNCEQELSEVVDRVEVAMNSGLCDYDQEGWLRISMVVGTRVREFRSRVIH